MKEITDARRAHIDALTVTHDLRLAGLLSQLGFDALASRPVCAAYERNEEWLRPIRQVATIADKLDGLRRLA